MLSKDIIETDKIAKRFLDKLLVKGGKSECALVVALSGELGAGKTAFTKAVAKHLGIKATVNSPTFVIMQKYSIPKRGVHKFLFHMDAYRLKNERELSALGWQEIISKREHLVFIEWPENVAKIIPADAAHISISSHEDGRRRFRFS